MKKLKELQVGKWYQSPGWSSKSDYAKLLIVDYDNNDRFHYSEVIVSGKYEEKMDWWSFDLSNIREIPLEEIQQYLPDNHPDKISKQEDEFLTNRVSIYVRYTKDFTTELFEAAMKYFKDNSEGIPRGMNNTYKGFQQETYLLYDNFNLHGEIVPKVLKRDLKGGYGYGVDNNRQGCQKELSIEGLKDFIGYKDSKSENKLPTQWYFKVTDENYKKFKDIRPLSGVYGYISSDPIFNLSWGRIYSDLPSGYTEISFEAFEKHVLNKESKSIKTEEPVKETYIPKFEVGDKVRIPLSKKRNLWYKNNVSELDDYKKEYFIIDSIYNRNVIGLKRADGKNFRENSFCEDDLVLYVEPTIEKWVPCSGTNNTYEITRGGLIRNSKTLKIKSQSISSKGYLQINTCINGKESTSKVHRLIAETFIPNPNYYNCVDHIDGNKLNNSISNLRWCSIQENNEFYQGSGGLYGSNLSKESILDIYNNYNNYGEKKICAKIYNIDEETVRLIKNGTSFKHITSNKLPTKSWY